MNVDLGEGLSAWVRTVTPLTDLIGEGQDCGFYPEALTRQKTPSFIIYAEQNDPEAAMHDAPATAATTTVTFTCVGKTRPEAVLLSRTLYDALMVPRFRGAMGTVQVQAVICQRSSPSYQWDEYQFAVEAEYVFCYNLQ